MKRPLAVTILGCLFIAVGLVGLAYHASREPLDRWLVLISLVRVLAVFGGVFLLLGRGWARWLVLAWMALHVGISFTHSWPQVAAHLIFLLLIAFFLLRPPASDYFARRKTS